MNFKPHFIIYIGIVLALIASWVSLYFYNSHYIVIAPDFTASAYQPNGFYYYYKHNCDTSCLTVNVNEDDGNGTEKFADSYNAQLLFRLMGFQVVSDSDITWNPSLLGDNSKVIILLHNEYVTQQEYDMIFNHPTINFYPNALYALVQYKPSVIIDAIEEKQIGQITLIGDITHTHNYFNWTEDNTNFERTSDGHPLYCTNQTFEKIQDDYRLNCWAQSPDTILKYILQIEGSLHQ